ncbi:unnamed protein product [Leptidea sinapis]|uniref:Uncharacterized protein n=1 Tax=Leptidea sinapis TaxID=189913 RepID=A0A5E4PZR5_9NEOP|nr:unnamed protein product [Leptidea sinapis]
MSRSDTNNGGDSFCNLINNAVPKAVKDGKFVLDTNDDQIGYSNAPVNEAVAPPSGFIPKLQFPKLKKPKLGVPKMSIPKLKPRGPIKAPRVGVAMPFAAMRKAIDEESSAERMERFKKGVQRMLRFVKVLEQFDEYISERTRIIIDKLSKTLAE